MQSLFMRVLNQTIISTSVSTTAITHSIWTLLEWPMIPSSVSRETKARLSKGRLPKVGLCRHNFPISKSPQRVYPCHLHWLGSKVDMPWLIVRCKKEKETPFVSDDGLYVYPALVA